MRRWLGDLIRAAANLVDKPKPIVIHVDAHKVSRAVLHHTLSMPKPAHRSLIERILGYIFGW